MLFNDVRYARSSYIRNAPFDRNSPPILGYRRPSRKTFSQTRIATRQDYRIYNRALIIRFNHRFLRILIIPRYHLQHLRRPHRTPRLACTFIYLVSPSSLELEIPRWKIFNKSVSIIARTSDRETLETLFEFRL